MLTLSWDLFIIVVFAVIVAYSFIVGRENTLKIIIGSYLAILTADGLGNLLKIYALSSQEFLFFLKFMGLANPEYTLLMFKILIFISAIVIIVLRGGFEVTPGGFGSDGALGVIMALIFGFLSAGLVISTMLIYVSGASFVSGTMNLSNVALSGPYKDSQMIRMMIDNYNFWFSLPAVAFLITSLFGKKAEA